MEFIIILVLWFLFCAGVGNLATRKGHSGAFWFLFAVLLSPLVGIFLMCLPDRTENIELRMLQSGANKKCPYCAEIIKFEAKVCRYCGKDVSLRPSEPSSGNREFVARQNALATGKTYRITKDGLEFGELTRTEVVGLLRSKDLAPEDSYFDAPSGSWIPLRNNPAFAA